MYLDYILLSLGGALLLMAVSLMAVLIRSRKRSLNYQRMLSEETERLDVLTTLRQSHTVDAKTDFTETITEPWEQGIAETELLPETESVFQPGPYEKLKLDTGLDLSPLEGKYELLQEIHGGGMSRIFLARSVKLGSEWIVKFVKRAELAQEAEVLKRLNHISLPQIIDIFQTAQGTFLVERYIEGYTLSEVLALGQEIKESQVCDWGLQLAQVLRYLHTLPTPIIQRHYFLARWLH